MAPWMLYGAGYTGQLIAREAVRRGLAPTLAGRDPDKVGAVARELGLAHRAFALDRADDAAGLDGMALVLHCAGPFSATGVPTMERCLRHGAHYLDITGEIDVFEQAHARDARARAAGVLLCPGVGFDVVPTDCVAAALKAVLPEATHLLDADGERLRRHRQQRARHRCLAAGPATAARVLHAVAPDGPGLRRQPARVGRDGGDVGRLFTLQCFTRLLADRHAAAAPRGRCGRHDQPACGHGPGRFR